MSTPVTDPPGATPEPANPVPERPPLGAPLLELQHVQQWFPVRKGLLGRAVAHVRAVDDVTLTVRRGETLGLVGESGCGKSTLARTALRLLEPTGGEVLFEGNDISHRSRRQLRDTRARMQMVFQDPQGSLNPRRRVSSIVGDALALQEGVGGSRRERAAELMTRVGLLPEHLDRYPNEFSGGQRQRIGIARALATNPDLVICDEPVSALDVSVQAQIVNLLDELQTTLGLTYVFVAHDLSVVRQVSDRVAVMYLGRIVETGPADGLYAKPRHHYTASLLQAIPRPDPHGRDRRPKPLAGEPPSPIDPPSGCAFHPRCPAATDRCKAEVPPLWRYADDSTVACHHPIDTTAAEIAAGSRDDTSPLSASDGAPEPSSAAAGAAPVSA